MGMGNGIDQCDCCGKTITRGRRVWLELDQRINRYHDMEFGVPERDSQGWFPFGATCAARLVREAREAAKAAGIFLGRRRIGRIQQGMMNAAMRATVDQLVRSGK